MSAPHAALLMAGGAAAAGVTWNPADKASGVTLSNGDLTATCAVADAIVRATTSHTTTGKFYFEIVMDTVLGSPGAPRVGISTSSVAYTNALFAGSPGVFAIIQDYVYTINNGSYKSAGPTFANGERCNVAVDLGANKIWFGRNGVWVLGGNPAAGTGETWIITAASAFFPTCRVNDGSKVTAHFASASWVDPAPSGFVAW